MYNEVDSTNNESIKSSRKKIASPVWDSSVTKKIPAKKKHKAHKRTVLK